MRGFLLSVDSMVAISLLLLMVLFLGSIVFTISPTTSIYQRLYLNANDMLTFMEEVKMQDLKDIPTVASYYQSGALTAADDNKTFLDVIGSLWAIGNTTQADALIRGVFGQYVNGSFQYELIIGNDVITTSSGPRNYVAKLSTIVSGYDVGKIVSGYISRAYITLAARTSSDYAYFGGFEGEGNLTKTMQLPTIDTVLDATLELATTGNFSLYINGQAAGTYIVQNTSNLTANSWILPPSAYSLFTSGRNIIHFNFTTQQNAYIGGGFLKVTYNTTDLITNSYLTTPGTATMNYSFPGIQGIINLYSSFYVPGNVTNISGLLHFSSDYPVRFLIGNTTLLQVNSTGEQVLPLNQSFFSAINLTTLSQRTVPLRFGVSELSLFGLGNVDTALITDRTGSMSGCDVNISCSTPGICDSNPTGGCHQMRGLVALSADKGFVDVVTQNSQANRVTLVGAGEATNPICSFYDFSNSNASLQANLDRYNYNNQWQTCGYTCISCGIVSATQLLTEASALYGYRTTEVTNTSPVHLGDASYVSYTEYFNITTQPQQFLKSRLTFLATGVDVDAGYKDCVYVNGNFLGRVCTGGLVTTTGWHTCEYPLEQSMLRNGTNNVTLTGANNISCLDTTGEQDDWDFIDVKLTLFETNQQSPTVQTVGNVSTFTLNSPGQINYSIDIPIAEVVADQPAPVDFTSGLNSSANTFGPSRPNDGWDYQAGTYGYGTQVDFNKVVNGKLEMDTATGSNADNRCSNGTSSQDCSGAYGISFNVSQNIINNISAGKRVYVSFAYEWEPNPQFETSDEVWIKGKWYSPSSGNHSLGTNNDTGHNGADSGPEIASEDDPDTPLSGFFYQNVTSWVEAAGAYYLDFGGTLLASSNNEWGTFRFDDVSAGIYNSTVAPTSNGINLTLNISGIDTARAALLSMEVNDVDPLYANCVFVNNNFIGRVDSQKWSGTQLWERVIFDVPLIYLEEGANNIRVTGGTTLGCERVGINDRYSFRNLSITLRSSTEDYNYTKSPSMLVMSDGEANTKIGDCVSYGTGGCPTVPGTEDPSQEAITKACEARQRFGIHIYTVAFGDVPAAALQTMQSIAGCDDPNNFFASNNATELIEIYKTIARDLLNITFVRQSTNVTGNVSYNSMLYPDSYLQFRYAHNLSPLQFGEVVITTESKTFGEVSGNATITDNLTGTKDGSYFVPNGSTVIDARVTSYSSDYWTDRLYTSRNGVNFSQVYRLADYGSTYGSLGDPYVVQIPTNVIASSQFNYVRLGTGVDASTPTGASPFDRVIYTLRIGGLNLEGYSDIYPKAKGSTIRVYYDIDADDVYDGYSDIAYGTDPTDVFDPGNDSIDDAFMRLLDQLDILFDKNVGSYGTGSVADPFDGVNATNPIDLTIASQIQFESSSVFGIPSLWGPVGVQLNVWT